MLVTINTKINYRIGKHLPINIIINIMHLTTITNKRKWKYHVHVSTFIEEPQKWQWYSECQTVQHWSYCDILVQHMKPSKQSYANWTKPKMLPWWDYLGWTTTFLHFWKQINQNVKMLPIRNLYREQKGKEKNKQGLVHMAVTKYTTIICLGDWTSKMQENQWES